MLFSVHFIIDNLTIKPIEWVIYFFIRQVFVLENLEMSSNLCKLLFIKYLKYEEKL